MIPPVMSILVWNEKMVSPRQMKAVIPIAMKTQATLWYTEIEATIMLRARVKIPSAIRLPGDFLRTPSQHTRVLK